MALAKIRNKKILSHRRRTTKSRQRIREFQRRALQMQGVEIPRIVVQRTSRHLRADALVEHPLTRQVVTVASASTLEADVKKQCKYTGNIEAAQVLGKVIAERVLKTKHNGLPKVVFDRSGYKYHGRIKAFADAARESGLDF